MLGLGGSKTRGTGPIGLALSEHEVRLAQRLAGGGYALACEALSQDVDPTGPAYHTEVSRAVSTALRRGGFAGKQVVSALPVQSLRYKTLRLPPMPDEELGQAIAWEAAERFQIKDDQALQYYRAGQVQQGGEAREEVILLSVPNQQVHDHALSLRHTGLNPVAIDATGAALARLFSDSGGDGVAIHLTPRVAEIVGMRQGQVIFDKPVELTVMQGQVDTVSLARELGLCLRYLSVSFGMHKPGGVWLCGAGADESMAQSLGAAMNMSLQTATSALSGRQVLCEPAEAGLWAVAIGLAERNEKGSAQRGAA